MRWLPIPHNRRSGRFSLSASARAAPTRSPDTSPDRIAMLGCMALVLSASRRIVASAAVAARNAVHEIHEVFELRTGLKLFFDSLQSLGTIQVGAVEQLVCLPE